MKISVANVKNRMDRLLNRISIPKKIMLIFLGCFIIPSIIQNVFYFSETEQNIQKEILQRLDNVLSDKANKINGSMYDAIRVSMKYNNNEQIYRSLDTYYKRDIDYLIAYQENIKRVVETDLPFYLQIDRIVFYTDNPTIFNGALVKPVIPFDEYTLGEDLSDYSEVWIKERENILSLRVAARHVCPELNNMRQISIMRTMNYYPQYSRFKKKLSIELNSNYYVALLMDSSLFDNLLLTDIDGRILFSANTYRQAGDFEFFDRNDLDEGMIVLEKQLNNFPVILYGYYNTNKISNEFRKSRHGIILISSLSVIIASLCVGIVGNNITKRTRCIVSRSIKIAHGDFNQIDHKNVGDDEFGVIEKGINQMSLQLQEFIDREYRTKLLQARLEKEIIQAKLLALQSQVNPHFLFNSLESIRLNALDNDKNETAKMIKHMSRMFRYLVDWDEDIVRLEDELKFLGEFLSIQKYRFGDDFHYTIDIEEGTKDCLLPKMIIQPLAENACIHGVQSATNEKKVYISIEIEDDWLVIKVKDNGGGICTERLEKLQNMLNNGKKLDDSIGLYNVHQRLSLTYGENFKFIIDSIKGQGTTCIVKIPLNYGN